MHSCFFLKKKNEQSEKYYELLSNKKIKELRHKMEKNTYQMNIFNISRMLE
jgi:hypothetical protein